MLFEDTEKDTIIKLSFSGSQYQLYGNVEELEMFWE